MKKIIEYEIFMDLMHSMRADIKPRYDLEDYDKILKSWQRLLDYFNSCPAETRGASLPTIKTSRL